MSDELTSVIPIFRLGPCLFVTVPTAMRDSEAQQLQENIVARLSVEHGVKSLVIDVSALRLIDSYVAKVLTDTAGMSRSLGARAMMVGIRPEVAVTLVELGIRLEGIDTALTLERALEKLEVAVVSKAVE